MLVWVAYSLVFAVSVVFVIDKIKGEIVSEVQDAVDAVVAQLAKAKAEVVGKIADVEAQLAAASVPAEVVDLSGLKAAAQALDDVVADAPVEAPVEEAPVDVPVEEV